MCQVDATPHTWCRPAASERRRSPCALAWAWLLSLGGVDRARPTLCLRCNVRRGSDPQMLLHFAWPALLEGVPETGEYSRAKEMADSRPRRPSATSMVTTRDTSARRKA